VSECKVSVGNRLGVDLTGRSPSREFLPVSPGEYPLDREYLGGPQPCLDARTQGGPEVPVQRRHRRDAGRPDTTRAASPL